MINNIIDKYLSFLKENIEVNELKGGAYQIITPFLDYHNDYIEMYAIQDGDHIILTDGGYTIKNLLINGVDISTDKRKNIFTQILNSHGIKFLDKDKELYVKSNLDDIGEKKHSLLQAILSITDMINLSRNNILSLFKEEIKTLFDENKIAYTENIELRGRSDLIHNIDFIIPKGILGDKEIIIKSLNNIDKVHTESTIFGLSDIKDTRSNSTPLVLYNKAHENKSSKKLLNAMKNYNIDIQTPEDFINSFKKLNTPN